MSILYIDEAGTDTPKTEISDTKKGGNSNFFVMSGVLIETDELDRLFNDFENIKIQYARHNDFELKSNLNGIPWRKNINNRHNNIKKDIYELISNSNIKAFGAQITKYTACPKYKIYSSDDIYVYCFEILLSIIIDYTNLTKQDSKIMVMIDTREKAHNKMLYKAYRKAMTKIFNDQKNFKKEQFSPTLNFVESEFSFGIQLADFVAGALWRGVEYDQKEYSNMIKNNFPKRNGKLLGFSYKNLH